MRPRKSVRLAHERQIQILVFTAALPAIVATVALLWTSDYNPLVRWSVLLVVLGICVFVAVTVRERVAVPLRTLANLLEALREGDYSIRGHETRSDDALSQAMQQVNVMAATLRDQRLGALEATTLLRKVIEEIDVSIFAFDDTSRLRLVNPAGEQLFSRASEQLLGRTAQELDLKKFLEGPGQRTLQCNFPSGPGRWGITRSSFREGGFPHHLLVITNLTRPLRDEELQAWQRLVRVLGHELNNSLTPIRSIAESLASMMSQQSHDREWQDDMRRGLSIISNRSESLCRFLDAYARLARLPNPRFQPVQIVDWIQQVSSLETRIVPLITPGVPCTIQGDPDQLQQLLINLLRNAVDASLETAGSVTISWRQTGTHIEVSVVDQGLGLANTANLFVPFFTTKPGGSGIGLVLSRQIAEAHGGSLTVENRSGETGCEARLLLPL